MGEKKSYRLFVEKKAAFNIEAQQLLDDLSQHLGIKGLSGYACLTVTMRVLPQKSLSKLRNLFSQSLQ